VTRIAFYAGSFDPVTNGHLDVIRQALRVADKLYVAVGENDTKNALFSFEERERMIRDAISGLPGFDKVIPVAFSGLAVDAARSLGAVMMVRGLRDSSDFDYEMRMATMNARLAPDIQTIFVAASPSAYFIAGTLVRQIAMAGGDVSGFVPPLAAKMLLEKYSKKNER
jgi:pantetheine-phosphate adenylyltransferase